jgi:hypothetical protein
MVSRNSDRDPAELLAAVSRRAEAISSFRMVRDTRDSSGSSHDVILASGDNWYVRTTSGPDDSEMLLLRDEMYRRSRPGSWEASSDGLWTAYPITGGAVASLGAAQRIYGVNLEDIADLSRLPDEVIAGVPHIRVVGRVSVQEPINSAEEELSRDADFESHLRAYGAFDGLVSEVQLWINSESLYIYKFDTVETRMRGSSPVSRVYSTSVFTHFNQDISLPIP